MYPFLNSLETFLICGMIFRPTSSKVLTINGKFNRFRIKCFQVLKDILELIVKFSHEVAGIIEWLIEICLRIFTRNRDIFTQEVCPSSIAHTLSIEMDGEVGSMNFLCCNPKDIFSIISFLSDSFYESVSGWEFEGWILFED